MQSQFVLTATLFRKRKSVTVHSQKSTVCLPVSGHFSLTLQELSLVSRKSSEIWPRENLFGPQHDKRQFTFLVFVSIAKLIFFQSSYVAQYPDTATTT